MITTVYPDYVQAQLDQIDEKIRKIYEEVSQERIINIAEQQRIKRNLYERIRPLIDEKCRLIENCCPKYVIERW